MPFESDLIRKSLKKVASLKVAGKKITEGRLNGTEVILINSGIGKVNAAQAATCIIERFPLKVIINIGVAGAYQSSGLRAGDIAIASREILGDEGVSDSKGWRSLKKINIPVLRRGNKEYYNEFPLENSLFKKSVRLITPELIHPSHPQVKSGPFVTLSAVSGSRARAGELEKRFHALCENMEGAAIAQVCASYNVTFLEVRGISNSAGVRDKRRWNLAIGSRNSQRAVSGLINRMS